MKRRGLLGACLAGAVAMGAGMATPAQAKTFAMVFKVLNNAFTPPLQAGCKAAAEKLGVTCTFMGPTGWPCRLATRRRWRGCCGWRRNATFRW
jgi:ABC-type sugar transport system substrate-binding protein